MGLLKIMIAYDGNATIKVLKGPNAGQCFVLSGNEAIIGREPRLSHLVAQILARVLSKFWQHDVQLRP